MNSAEPPALVLEQPHNPAAAARSRVYASLSGVFGYPDAELAATLRDGSWLVGFHDDCAALPYIVSASSGDTNVGEDSDASLKRRYSALFDVTGGSPKISLLERRYVNKPEQELWEGLLRFYAHFGLDFARASSAEQPDHLLTELSFMHYLGYLEAAAPSGAAALQRGQRDFLDQHLCPLLDGVRRSAGESESAGIYGEIAVLADAFARADARYCQGEQA